MVSTAELIAAAQARQQQRQQQGIGGLAGQIGSAGISAISGVGNLLDVPGSMVRDVVGGQNPFDQLLTPFSSENRLTGRQLLRQGGAVGPENTWGNFGGGLATEIALDPLTYLTFGGSAALSRGGQIASKAGLLNKVPQVAGKLTGKTAQAVGPRTAMRTMTLRQLYDSGGDIAKKAIDDALEAGGTKWANVANNVKDQALGQGAGFKIPFTGKIAPLPKSAQVADAYARYADAAGRGLARSLPGQAVRALFDYRVGGRMGADLQEAMIRSTQMAEELLPEAAMKEIAFREQMEALGGAMRQTLGDETLDALAQADHAAKLERYAQRSPQFRAKNPAPQLLDAEKKAQDLAGRMARHVQEVTPNPLIDEMADAERLFLGGQRLPDELRASIRAAGAEGADVIRDNWDLYKKMGGAASDLAEGAVQGRGFDILGHLPRGVSRARQAADPAMFEDLKQFSRIFESAQSRTAELQELPAGIINQILLDPANDDHLHLLARYGDYLSDQWGNMPLGGNVISGKEAHAASLAEWAQSHLAEELFTRALHTDVGRYLENSTKAIANLEATFQMLQDPTAMTYFRQGKALPALLKQMRLNPDRAMQYISQRTGRPVDQLRRMSVRDDLANAMAASRDIEVRPEWSKMIGDNLEKATQVWKSAVTAIGGFPSFQVRNFLSGQHMNLVSGEMRTLADLGRYFQEMGDARKLLGDIRSGNLTPAQQQLVRELEAYGVVSRTRSEDAFGEITQRLEATPLFEEYLTSRPWKEAYDAAKARTAANPSRVPDRVRTAYNTVSQLGSNTNQAVEWANRVPMYTYLRKKGYTPAAASSKVIELQFDYSRLSPFEKKVMRTLVPFYSFSRFAAPATMRRLAQEPGGALGQTIRAYNYAANETPETSVRPDWMGQQFSVHLGQRPDGSERFLVSGGLAFEDPLSLVPAQGLQAAGYEALGRLTPAIQAPLEMITNQSFFRGGQPLTSLDPSVARTISNVGEATGLRQPGQGPATEYVPDWIERVAAYSPTSRVLGRVRQATDPRKSWAAPLSAPFDLNSYAQYLNQLSGVKVTDVSPSQQLRQLDQRTQEALKRMGGRDYTRTYIPKRQIERMTPAQREEAERFNKIYLAVQRERKRLQKLEQRRR